MLVLKLLKQQDMYGYQIIRELEQQSQNVFKLQEGTLYPILHALEQQGGVTSYQQTSDNGRVRKYYAITSGGQKLLEEYESQGLSPADAERQAIGGMGDAISIGTELNEAHRLQKFPQLIFITALLLLTGFLLSAFMHRMPEQGANGFLYYIPGGVLLIFTALRGYPLLIRYRKWLALFICFLYSAQMILFFLRKYIGIRLVTPSAVYFATLLSAPVITVLLYCSRRSRKKFLAAAFGCAGMWMLFIYSSGFYLSDTATIIFLLSMLGTACFMIHRQILSGRKKSAYSIALVFLLLLGSPLFLTDSGRAKAETFLAPQSAIYSTWDDTYNGILVQELLSRTPLAHGLNLSPAEMMDYGTGAWYFSTHDTQSIGLDATGIQTDEQRKEFQEKSDALWDQGYLPRYINYQADDVTLWDILPQHYHNNYLITVSIFLFGWLPGLALIGVIGLFYLFLFSCIARIHGHLASSLAFCCGQCLLWQGIFYLLGNFGYQYASFPNLPLVSEGKLSIVFNMLLLGMIISAYRFDHVIEEPVNYRPAAS